MQDVAPPPCQQQLNTIWSGVGATYHCHGPIPTDGPKVKWGESEAQCAREKFLDHWAEEYTRGQKEVLQDRRGLSSCKQ
jgi:hypothetical protein